MPKYSSADGRPLTPDELVEKFRRRGVSTTKQTLAWRRSVGGGPPYLKVNGRAVYPERLVDEYLDRLLDVEVVDLAAAALPRPTGETLVTRCGLSGRASNALRSGGFRTLGEVAAAPREILPTLLGMGAKSLAEVRALLDSFAEAPAPRRRPRPEEGRPAI